MQNPTVSEIVRVDSTVYAVTLEELERDDRPSYFVTVTRDGVHLSRGVYVHGVIELFRDGCVDYVTRCRMDTAAEICWSRLRDGLV